MNSDSNTRRKWELGIAGFIIAVAAVCSGWLCGVFGNVPPYPRWFHDHEVRRRAEEATKQQEAAVSQAAVYYPSYKWEPKSLESLRNRQRWEGGKISLALYHDVAANILPIAGQIPVCLINDTDQLLSVPAQGGDIYLELEVMLEDGQWHRSQAHLDSWCGNSYVMRPLPRHTYVVVGGYQPTTGRSAKTRFAIHNGAEDRLVSDEFDGVYGPDDVELSKFDHLAMREADLLTLKTFLLRRSRPMLLLDNVSISELRYRAWDWLLSGYHEKSEALTVARKVFKIDPALSQNMDIEKRFGQRKAAMDDQAKKEPRIHGFLISEELVQSHAK